MTIPAPRPGMVIRYSFLWSREARQAATEGRKDRPCAIVVAVPRDEQGGQRVVVVPITHAAPDNPETAIPLPSALKLRIGLDDQASWICLDELNVFAWPGYDLTTIPGKDRIDYGALPRDLFERVRSGVLALHRSRRARQVDRD